MLKIGSCVSISNCQIETPHEANETKYFDLIVVHLASKYFQIGYFKSYFCINFIARFGDLDSLNQIVAKSNFLDRKLIWEYIRVYMLIYVNDSFSAPPDLL